MYGPTQKNPALKIAILIVSFILLYIFLPLYLMERYARPPSRILWLFYLSVNAFAIAYLGKKNSQRKYQLEYQVQSLEEKINVLNDQNLKESKVHSSLQEKIIGYNGLKQVVEEINQSLELDSVADKITAIVFSLISHNKGVCILYLVDVQNQKLGLFKTKKEDEKLVIKAKEGDIFDFWVLRHTSPLLIEDTKQDFRFDLEKLKAEDTRPIASLMSCPLLSEHRFLGILRLDSPQTNFYSQDDLRLLAALCDLGAVALENSELFQKTQDLAIHDELTALYTKAYFLERLRYACLRGVRQDTVFALFMLDIDFFKNYNDKFGHSAGDIVLKNMSRIIAESLKDLNPILSRFGGEEFCIILEGIDKKNAYRAADELCKRIEKEKIILRRQETNVTVSIGIAVFPSDANDEDGLIQKADWAMYEAKRKGRNQACCI